MGVSPYSTGGGGTVLEHRYAAVLLSALLTRGPLEELGDPLVEAHEIRLQARDSSRVDDIVIIGRRARGSDEFAACIGVRRDPAVVPSDDATVKLIANYLRDVADHWGEFESGHRRLVLAVTNRSVHASQLSDLADLAKGLDAADFRSQAAKSGPTNTDIRSRLRSFDAVVAKASKISRLDVNALPADELTWRLLRNLSVQCLRLEGTDKRDRSHAVELLRPHAFEDSVESAEAAFSKIEHLVGGWASTAARVTEPMLRRALSARLKQRFSVLQAQVKPHQVEADAVARGPLAHLGLEQDFKEAQALESSDPASAAGRYGRLAGELSAWPASALSMRRRQAANLHKAGDHDAGTTVDVTVMASALQAGEPWLVNSLLSRLSQEKVEASDHLIRAANALGDLAAFEHHHEVSLDDVTATIEALSPQSPHALFAAAWFAEHAIAMDRPDLLTTRSSLLDALAEGATASETALQARLRACLADTDHSGTRWTQLKQVPYAPDVKALLRARYARFLAETGNGEEALEQYGEAIERAVRLGLHADAAAWLEAQSLVRLRYSPQIDGDDPYPKTSVLRSVSQRSSIPAPYHVRERALGRLANHAHRAECREAIVQYRRHAVASASWNAEREALELFGRLYLDDHLAHDAAAAVITAGRNELLDELAERLPEKPADLPPPPRWRNLPRWKRKSMFLGARSMVDLLPDWQARSWSDLAMEEIIGLETVPPAHPYTHEAALGFLQAAAPAFSADQAHRFVDITEHWQRNITVDPRIGRPYAGVMVTIARQHTGILRIEAVDRICQALLSDYTMSGVVLEHPDVLRLQPSVVADRCSAPAGPGVLKAAMALVFAGSPADQYRPFAQALLDGHLAKPGSSKPPGEASLERTAWLAAHLLEAAQCEELAETLIKFVRDHDQSSQKRQGALRALAHVASYLTDRQHIHCFETAMDATRGSLDGGAGFGRPANHPLDRFRRNRGPDTLRYAGIRAAVKLARTPAHAAQIVTEALPLLAHSEEDANRVIATHLAILPSKDLGSLIPSLVGHSSPWVRALAAHLWCHSDVTPDQRIGHLLASDPSHHVRSILARSLPHGQAWAGIRSMLIQDCRRSVRCEAAKAAGNV